MEELDHKTLSIVKQMGQPVYVVGRNWKKDFVASLERLVKQGFLRKEKDGVLTSYLLTQKGKEAS